MWKFPYGNLPKQSSKKFASEPPKLLRSPSRSGSMQKLVAESSEFLAPRSAIRKKGVQFRNPETIRENLGGAQKGVNKRGLSSGFRKRGLANGVSPFFSENETEKNGRKRKKT